MLLRETYLHINKFLASSFITLKFSNLPFSLRTVQVLDV